jgi:hypothetical protein
VTVYISSYLPFHNVICMIRAYITLWHWKEALTGNNGMWLVRLCPRGEICFPQLWKLRSLVSPFGKLCEGHIYPPRELPGAFHTKWELRVVRKCLFCLIISAYHSSIPDGCDVISQNYKPSGTKVLLVTYSSTTEHASFFIFWPRGKLTNCLCFLFLSHLSTVSRERTYKLFLSCSCVESTLLNVKSFSQKWW